MATRYEYETKYGLVRITNCISDDKEIKVPSKIDGKNVYQICSGSFINLPVERLYLPKTIGKIEDSAFVNLNNLTYFECHNIDDFKLPFDMDVSKVSVFSYSLLVADIFEKVSPYNFLKVEYFKDLKWDVISEKDKTARIKSFICRKNELIFPDEIDGYKIIEINGSVNRGGIVSIHLPKYLKKIPDKFLMDYEGFDMNIPDTLEEIGNYAFKNTYFGRTVMMPKTLKVLGEEAFYTDEQFKGEELIFSGKTVINLGAKSLVGRNVCFKKSVKFILEGEGVFKNTNISSICFSDFNKIIPKNSFNDANILNHYNLCKIESIGAFAFRNAQFLKKKLFDLKNVKYLGDYAFCYCNILKYKIPKDLKLSVGCFEGVYAEEIVFAKDYIYDTIPAHCFKHTKSLTKMKLPEAIRVIGSKAFLGSYIKTINLEKIHKLEDSSFASSRIDVAKLNNLRYLESRAFLECAFLKSVDMRGSFVTDISDFCFYNCGILHICKISSFIERIGSGAFCENKKLEAFDFRNIKEIGGKAFSGTAIIKADMKSIQWLGPKVFCDCYCLKVVNISRFLKVIPEACFESCGSLEKLNLKNVEFLGFGCLRDCGIKKLIIPKSMKEVDDYALCGSKIEELVFRQQYPVKKKEALHGLYRLKTLYIDGIKEVPSQLASFYGDVEEIVFMDSISKIHNEAIHTNLKLKKVVIKNSSCDIGKRNFYGCRNLKTLYIDNKTTFKAISKKRSNTIKEQKDIKDFSFKY